jgi:hypothetical protein
MTKPCRVRLNLSGVLTCSGAVPPAGNGPELNEQGVLTRGGLLLWCATVIGHLFRGGILCRSKIGFRSLTWAFSGFRLLARIR